MRVILYKFVDGTVNAVEVTEELYLIHLQLVQMEKRNHWKETRRHTSLYYFTEMGIDFEDKHTESPLDICIRKESIEQVHKALSTLTDKRQALVHNVFYEETSMREIARQSGLCHSAISQQMKTIRGQLQKWLKQAHYV